MFSINSEFKLVSSEIKISNDLGANSAYFKVGEFRSQDGRLLNVSSSLGFKEGYQLEVSSSGDVGDYTLIQDDKFLGNFKNVDFKMMSKMNVKGPPYNFSNSTSMSFTDVPNLNLYFEGSVDFESWDDFLNCKTKECDVQSITADYSIVLDDDRVDGQAFCASDSCNFNNQNIGWFPPIRIIFL